jgi:predicted RNA-binding protein Jag
LPGEQRVFVNALEYRKGKDVELRHMANSLPAQQAGIDRQLGPLHPAKRRIVHLAVAEVPGRRRRASATTGTVLISKRK